MRIIALAAVLIVPPALAGDEWLDSPNKFFFQNLQRPDNHKFPDRDKDSLSCCGPGDLVKTKFKVERASVKHPRDIWYAWFGDDWIQIPEDRIVPDYAPDGQGHLFMARAPDLIFGGPDFVALLCFVRPKGGL